MQNSELRKGTALGVKALEVVPFFVWGDY